jgi:hypothetical protein
LAYCAVLSSLLLERGELAVLQPPYSSTQTLVFRDFKWVVYFNTKAPHCAFKRTPPLRRVVENPLAAAAN